MNFFKSFNSIKILIVLYLLIFIFLFSYTFYRAEFIYNGNQFPYYYKYYSIFLSGILFWLVVLFLNRTKKIQILVGITSLIFLVYSYEVFLYTKSSKNILEDWQRDTTRAKINLINKIKKENGIDVVPSIFPRALINKYWTDFNFNLFPISGVSNITTVFCKEGKEFSIYESDRFGFNNPDKEWNNEKIDWLLLGDSFTQGSCVQPGDDFASQIRLLSKQNVLSLGMAGNGPLLELASLVEYGLKKKPKIVLWIYFERNDLDDLKYEKSNSILKKYLQENFNQNLFSRQSEINIKLKQYIQKSKKEIIDGKKTKSNDSIFLAFNKIIRLQILRDKTALDRGLNFGMDPLFEEIMRKAKNLVNKFNGKLYFVYLPDKERYTNKKISNDDVYLKRSNVLELINNLNISIIDIHKDFFLKQVDPLSFYADRIYGHYSPNGYHQISKTIVNKINSKYNN